MAWYVFALVDQAPSRAKGKGLSGPLALRSVPGGFAVVERRADVPPAEFGPLKRHHDVVAQLASRVSAILPVRFGTLMEEAAIDEALDERGADIAAAFAVVRDRAQFTWRREGGGAARKARGAKSEVWGLPAGPGSGREYLRRAAEAAKPAPPAAWRTLRTTLAPLVRHERYQPAAAGAREALYHLVDRDAAIRYTTLAGALQHSDPRFRMTGPWPPFAFVPEML
jgi:hypothetical protein